MNRFFILIGFCLCVASCCTWLKRGNCNVITKRNPVYTLTLKSNPTTGYAWRVVDYDRQLLQLKGHRYIAPDTKLIGAPGHEVWQFNATSYALKSPNTTTQIKMAYVRPWEVSNNNKIDPKQIKVFTVKIKP